MPKISELTVGTALTGAEEIPAVQAGVTKQITPAQIATYVGSGLGVYNVLDYGAVGDGSTNDTTAIQAAITAAGAAGGGVVYIPAGTYHIRPATSTTEYALTVDDDNIVVMGQGAGISKLVFHHYDGTAGTNYHLVSGAVLRGHGFFVQGGHENITFQDFELDGGAPKTDNVEIPANPATGNGWDITHKGIYFEVNLAHDRMTVKNCSVHSWRGEMIYHGGNLFVRGDVIDCTLYDTNASGVSISASNLRVIGNEIYDCFSDGIENGYFGGRNVYAGNYVHDCGHNGMAILPVGTTYGFAEIYDNHFFNCSAESGQQPTLYLGGPRNMRVYNNLFVDCIGFNIYLDCNDSYSQADNVEVYGNRFVADQLSINSMIYIATGTNAVTRLQIHDNTGVVSLAGRTGGEVIRRAVNLDENVVPGNIGSGYRNSNNELMDGSQDSSELRRMFYSHTTTAGHIIGYYKESSTFVRRVFVDFTVITAGTDYLVDITFTFGGVAKTRNLVPSATYAVGSYSYWQEIFTDGIVTVTATAGTASHIFVNCEIISLP